MKICTLLILSLLVCLGAAQTTDVCPDGLSRDRYLQVHGNSCFRFVAKPTKDYNDAEADCERHGGTLAMVKNKDIENYLLDQLSQYKVYTTVWIGAQDKVSESHWEWEDGTPVEYTNWAFDEGPGHIWGNAEEEEDCIGMDYHGYWHDYKCEGDDSFFSFINDNTFPYVCQYPIKSGLETPKTTGTTPMSSTQPRRQKPQHKDQLQ